MYLREETRPATEAFWALTRDALRDHGISAPDTLTQDAPLHATWGRPDLVLGQICNLPYRADFHGRVTLIAAADYGLPDAPAGHYYSVFVTRASDPRTSLADFANARLAFNDPGSHSGWGAPWMVSQAQGFNWTRAVETGGHRASAKAIAEGEADIAAIDAVSWALIQRYDADASDLHVIGRTASSPGLTFIAALGADTAAYRAALSQALTAMPDGDQDTIMLRALVPLAGAEYTRLPLPPAPPLPSQQARSA